MRSVLLVSVALIVAPLLSAQTDAPKSSSTTPAPDYSGTYSFLREGEFVEITLEDGGRVTGFVSRYGDEDNTPGTFLDHFFKQGKLEGQKLSFTTQTVHGVWYEFKGEVERGEGKNPGDEAYYVLKGTLVEFTTDAKKNTSSKPRAVAFKSFPRDLEVSPGKPN
jgi:hypothetical protein